MGTLNFLRPFSGHLLSPCCNLGPFCPGGKETYETAVALLPGTIPVISEIWTKQLTKFQFKGDHKDENNVFVHG